MGDSRRLRVLWLCSWYPSEVDPFAGDFIQRHAEVVASFADVHVIHVIKSNQFGLNRYSRTIQHRIEGLTEEIIYYNLTIKILGKILSQILLTFHYSNAVRNYIKSSGKPNVLHYHVSQQLGFSSIFISRLIRMSYLLSEHWGGFLKRDFGGQSYIERIRELGMRRLITNARSIHVVSNELKDALHEKYSVRRFQVIPNVVNIEIFVPSKNKPAKFTYLHISDCSPLKGAFDLVMAVKILVDDGYDLDLLIVGCRNQEFVGVVREFGMQDVITVISEIPHVSVAGVLQNVHAMVHPSYLETFGCVVAEAFAVGLPVVAYDIPVLREIIIESYNGVFAKNQDPMSLAEAMKYVIDNYNMFSSNEIAEYAKVNFGKEILAKAFKEWYESNITDQVSITNS